MSHWKLNEAMHEAATWREVLGVLQQSGSQRDLTGLENQLASKVESLDKAVHEEMRQVVGEINRNLDLILETPRLLKKFAEILRKVGVACQPVVENHQ